MNQSAIQFRPYASSDLARCAELAEQAWPLRYWMDPDTGDAGMMQGYIEWAMQSSTRAEVACDGGKVIGVLIGKIDKQSRDRDAVDFVTDEPRMIFRVLLGRYGRPRNVLRMICVLLITEMKLLILSPDSDAEIIILIVDKDYRGRGIGRMLVDRFVSAAREAGSSSMLVYTDEQASNWQFYEIYGFKKVATFYDNASTFFNRRPTNGLLYLLELKQSGPAGSGTERA